MDKAEAEAIFDRFLREQEAKVSIQLAAVGQTRCMKEGWVFTYNSKSFAETGDFRDGVVGQGFVVVLHSGQLIQGGSAERTPGEVLRRHGVRQNDPK